MPALADLEHLLRRTEYVARPARIAELQDLSLAAAVDNILAVPANPGSANLTASQNWQRGSELTHHWLDRMAHDSPRPIQEKMGFFWHGHFCSEFSKVGSADLMKQQIDTFRVGALSNVRDLAITMSTQVAMLRYLDNNRNRNTSPNQNFARELMELFILGVGNYTEADVEAATAAWTGHTDNWETDAYVWRADWHDGATKSYLGRTINSGGDPTAHGRETIEVMLGDGTVPADAPRNGGRQSKRVAAEFLSRKLWIEFAGTEPPPSVLSQLRETAVTHDFAVAPWLKVLLTLDDFYAPEVKQGLVRSPVEFMVALLAATGRRSTVATPLWLMEGMGQRPLFPPNVSGWKHNGYWVNASAMAKRTEAARSVIWRSMDGYWNGDGLLHLKYGTIARHDVEETWEDQPLQVLDEILRLADLQLTPGSYAALADFSTNSARWQRSDLFSLVMLAPEFQIA